MRLVTALTLALIGFIITASSIADARGHHRSWRRHHRPARCYEMVKNCAETTNTDQCMTCNAVREALNQGFEGMVQVNQTVIARAKSGMFPEHICEVIYQPYQFSWTRSPRTCVSPEGWELAKKSVKAAKKRGSNAKLFYHANYVRPMWARRCSGRRKVGDHIFYGMCGTRTALIKFDRTTLSRIAVRPHSSSANNQMSSPMTPMTSMDGSLQTPTGTVQ